MTDSFEVECPHCHKTFAAELLEGAASRYRGFKCPHCKLFVPAERVEPVKKDDVASCRDHRGVRRG